MLITEGPPRTFDAWRYCITQGCGIVLTPEYARERLRALRAGNDLRTARFIELYGADHLLRVIGWRAATELTTRNKR